MCVLDGEGSKLFASRVLAVLQTAMYLIGYRDYRTCFREPFPLPYRCHSGLINVYRDYSLLILCGKGMVCHKKVFSTVNEALK